ncbi:hypothetical protein A4G99_01935 [Haladaptatus sp. R4]|uniref:hypothetical protein n=1 Tax=unclassified Haladaptatus TaxID=2622732 RepID=UPI0007B4DE86|nr:hypothetical protein [Haladaptatus sp. R4]KZN25295.1 hypothetical protein A4G99_01935 [Haladaptatus sp. R4]
METADERALEIGRRSSRTAYIALSALLLAVVVAHVYQHGFDNFEKVRFEFLAFLLGQAVYFGSGLYYRRVM